MLEVSNPKFYTIQLLSILASGCNGLYLPSIFIPIIPFGLMKLAWLGDITGNHVSNNVMNRSIYLNGYILESLNQSSQCQ